MKRRILAVLWLLAVGMVTMGAEGCSTETSGDTKQASGDSGGDAAARDDAPVAPEPDGEYSLNCDYLLGDFSEGSESGYKFVAGGEVKNTGNVGTVIEVKAEWELLGTDPAVETRRQRLRPGQTKDVQMTRLATQGEIDAHQSADGRCEADATILRTFGRAR